MDRSDLVTLRGGLIVDARVIDRLLDLEERGFTFDLLDDGRFRVLPLERLTNDDVGFLRAHRHHARAVIAYVADDRHLTAGPALKGAGAHE
jgi:hypothetical protein